MEAKSKFYVVWGDPIPLARVRHSNGRFYDSQKHLKVGWGLYVAQQHGNMGFLKGPIFMDVIFYMPIPKGVPAKKAELLRGQYHSIKPDASNLLKFVEDVVTAICYHDDCIIAKQTIEKVYDDGKGPRTEFYLSELTGTRAHRELT